MDGFSQMLGDQAVLLIFVLCGALCSKLGIITKDNHQKFVSLVLSILMPCMVFNSFRDITADVLSSAAEVVGVSLVVCMLSWLIGRVLFSRFNVTEQPVLRYATLVNNAGFAGLPLAQQMFGDTGLIYASVFLIPIRFFMWSAGVTMLSGEKMPVLKLLRKIAMNPNIVAIFFGLARGLLQLVFPLPIETALLTLSSCVLPISMIIVGAIIVSVDVRTVFSFSTLFYSGVRLVVLPLVTLFLATFFGIGKEIAGTCMVVTAMPAAASTVLLSSQYGANEVFAAKLVFVSTLLSMLSAPLLMLLL